VHILQPRPLPAQWRVPILQRMHTVRYDVSPAEADACLLSMLHLFDPLKVQAPDVALTASAVAAGSVMRTIRNACVLQIMSATSAN